MEIVLIYKVYHINGQTASNQNRLNMNLAFHALTKLFKNIKMKIDSGIYTVSISIGLKEEFDILDYNLLS